MDDTMQQIFDSIVELSRDSADVVAWTLAELLQGLAKQDPNSYFTVDVLQSQLLVLKVLSVAMAARWRNIEESRPTTRTGEYSTGYSASLNSSSPTAGRYARSHMSRDALDSPPPIGTDLPPLKDECAKYVLSVMVLFLRQTAPPEGSEPDTSLSYLSVEVDDQPRATSVFLDLPADSSQSGSSSFMRPFIRPRASAASFGSQATRAGAPIPIPRDALAYTNTPQMMADSLMSLNSLIAKYAGFIVYHLSASNWQIVFNRVRHRIRQLAKADVGNATDVIDLQLMTQCALDKTRLIQLLQEVSALFLEMKKEAQLVLATPIGEAVWHWIDLYPEEFAESVSGARRLDGAPERLYDHLTSGSLNDPAHKQITYPTLAVLLCISYERLERLFEQNHGGRGLPRKESLIEQLVKLTTRFSTGRLAPIAFRCLLDICKAASRSPKRPELPLRLLANDIIHEIKAVLFSHPNQRPFWESPSEIDCSLYADALVMIYRFLEEEATDIFLECLKPERSEAVKLTVVLALRTIAKEANQFSWNSPVWPLWNATAPRLRFVFQHAASRSNEVIDGITKRTASRPKSKGYALHTLTDRDILLLATLSFWRTDITHYLLGLRIGRGGDVWNHLWSPIGTPIWDNPNENEVKLMMGRSFKFFIDTAFVMGPDDPFVEEAATVLPKLTPQYLHAACNHLLHARVDFKAQEMWIGVLDDLLKTYIRPSQYTHVKNIQEAPERIPAFYLAEIVLLVLLTSVNNKVSILAAQNLRVLAIAERQTAVITHTAPKEDEGGMKRSVYEQLGEPKILLGRVQHQRGIRKIVSRLAAPIPQHMAVWQECYHRWMEVGHHYKLTVPPERGRDDGRDALLPRPLPSEDLHHQWRNLTLFLAAFGAACVPSQPYGQDDLNEWIPPELLPDALRTIEDCDYLVESYLSTLITLLTSDIVAVRDVARDALGSELSPRLYPRLYRELDRVVSDVTLNSSNVRWSEDCGIFLDQFISVLKMLFDNLAASPEEDMVSLDFGRLLSQLSFFIGKFNDDPAAARARIRFCSLVESASKRAESRSLMRNTNTWSQEILGTVSEWIKDPKDVIGSAVRDQEETNMACLRAVVSILERIPLTAFDGVEGEEKLRSANHHFVRYSDLIMRMLEFNQRPPTDDNHSDHTSHSQRGRLPSQDPDLRELVTMGITHLVRANPEVGFRYGINMAYDKDPETRTMFARIGARALERGVRLGDQENPSTSVRRNRFCELVRDSDMILALAICEICPPQEIDIVIPVLFNIFDERSTLMELLRTVIDREVASTTNEAELFRGNSMCTRMLSMLGRLHGFHYLRSVVEPLVKLIVSQPPGCGYEINPSKVTPEELETNLRCVMVVGQGFLDIIAESIPALPSLFREICAHISRTVLRVWPEAKFAALGAFMFLRFISPAVVSPGTVDVEVPPDPNIRHGLLMMAKITQNLANNIYFGKEIHMAALNEFMKENINKVTRFLSETTKYSTALMDQEADEWLGTSYDDSDNLVLHRFFESHADKIGKELLTFTADPENETTIAGKKAWRELCALLVEIGPPIDLPKLSNSASYEHAEYLDLLDRHRSRNTEAVHGIFFETTTPRDPVAIFVLSMRKINIEVLDIDLLMYHIFKTLTSRQNVNRNFEIVFDYTFFEASCEVPIQWLKYCLELIPKDIRQRFQHARILNLNQLAQRYLRRIYNGATDLASSSIIKVYSSIAELKEDTSDAAIASLDSIAKLEQENFIEFKDVSLRQSAQMRAVVDLKIGETHIRMISVKAQAISPEVSCKTTDIIAFTDISDVYNVFTGHDPFEFIVRKRHSVTLYFSSRYRDYIVKQIRDARGKMRGLSFITNDRAPRHQSNVHATLIHIGMGNMCHENSELRSASLELLAAVCADMNADEAVSVTSGCVVPTNPASFTLQFSEEMAKFAPHLTLDIVMDICRFLHELSVPARLSQLQALGPWVQNLVHYTDPTHELYEMSGAKLRESIRYLVDLTTEDQDLYLMVQRYVWNEVGKSDMVLVNVVLDELVRAAMDAGVQSRRCEIIGETIASMTSVSVRGRLFAKFRKALNKTSSQATFTLASNPHWNEIASLTYLTLAASGHASGQTRSAAPLQVFMPEIAHLVTIVGATGEVVVRKAVYLIVVNLLQALRLVASDDNTKSQIRELLQESSEERTLQSFGLVRLAPGGYANYEAPRREVLNLQEHLAETMIKIMSVTADTTGLLNVWRARWMSLLVASAFQQSPCIQSRAFVVIGMLATQNVDDDLLYQMLVALKTALAATAQVHSEEDAAAPIISMLRCITRVVPALETESRYLASLFWLAVALLHSSYLDFFEEAANMLSVTIETMEAQGFFSQDSVADVLLSMRMPLEDTAVQLDDLLGLSFQSSFSFSLVATIFKGIRVNSVQVPAQRALRALLKATARAGGADMRGEPDAPLVPDALAYFLALLPVSTSRAKYKALVADSGAHSSWIPESAGREESENVPRVASELLGISDNNTALLATSFMGVMLSGAQGDDAESEIVYTLLSDIASVYPDIVALAYESMQDRIKYAFGHSVNPAVLSAASHIFRVGTQDQLAKTAGPSRGSASTLGTIEESVMTGMPGRQVLALDEIGMPGLAKALQFYQPGQPNPTNVREVIAFIAKLVEASIS